MYSLRNQSIFECQCHLLFKNILANTINYEIFIRTFIKDHFLSDISQLFSIYNSQLIEKS